MKEIIGYMLEIMTYEQKVELWEQFNGETFSITDFELWMDYYFEYELTKTK